jgi:NAD-dependent protein deacetylase/lipoamidase
MRCHEATRCDVFLTVGTSAVVNPTASLVREALMRGAYTAEINLEATPASGLVDHALRGPAETILAEVNEQLGRLHGSESLRGSR